MVERGVGSKLIVQCTVQVLGEFAIVVGFHDFLRGVIQGAVAVKDAQAIGGQVFLVSDGDPAYHASQADGIVWPAEILEDHIRLHMMNPDHEEIETPEELGEDLIGLVRAYLK